VAVRELPRDPAHGRVPFSFCYAAYQTLDPEQRRRMAFLAIFAVREMRDAVEERRVRSEDDDDE
jgi:hypothetical protein